MNDEAAPKSRPDRAQRTVAVAQDGDERIATMRANAEHAEMEHISTAIEAELQHLGGCDGTKRGSAA